MQVIGFNLSKISAEKKSNIKDFSMNTNIEFTDIEKEKIEALKESEAVKINFKFSINYEENSKDDKKDSKTEKPSLGEVEFEGLLVMSVNKEESKNIQKSWKKKQLPPALQLPLYNFILRKCSARALSLEEELTLPPHIPFPQLKPTDQQTD
tara:strand:+ start:105 stop:560 length:456 start_codon:yes stop_codon:yes gene_type:complete